MTFNQLVKTKVDGLKEFIDLFNIVRQHCYQQKAYIYCEHVAIHSSYLPVNR